MIDFPVTSRAAPNPETVLKAKELFEKVEYPILMHCKSGADRAGLMSALYLVLNKNISVEKAKKQLSFKYLHIKYAKTGILDEFFEKYLKDNQLHKIKFLDWVQTKYNAEKLKSSFKPKKLFEIIITVFLKRE